MSEVRHPCIGMSKRQREVFENIAVGLDKGIHPATAAALMSRGLIQRKFEVVGRDAFGPIEIPRYWVPPPIHHQWCEWCAENVPDEP